MSNVGNRTIWAKLMFNLNVFDKPVEIREDRFTIGQATTCSLYLGAFKQLSPQHCAIERTADGRVFISDFSTTGVFVNGVEPVGTGNRKQIFDGSIISLGKRSTHDSYFADISFTVKLISEKASVLPKPPVGPAAGQQQGGPPVKRPAPLGQPAEKKPRIDTEDQGVPAVLQNIKVSTPVSKNDNAAGPSSAGDGKSTKPKDGSSIADNLVCSICFEIIHDCITLLPCMHCFCAGCYSDWNERSEQCPECRVKVRRLKKSHILNNVIEAYLSEHPDKKRSDEEIKALDAKNKITREMLTPKRARKQATVAVGYDHGSDCDCSECEYSCSEDSDDDDNDIPMLVTHGPRCRCCTGNQGVPAQARPYFRPCAPGQPHIYCQCCFSVIPDRRGENNPTLPPITCAVCQRTFCNLYFGCSRIGCFGCLALLKDIKFGHSTYDDIVNGNQYETNILKGAMARKNRTWIDVIRECMEKLDRNEFVCTDKMAFNLTSESPLCQICGLRNLRDLIYQYRQHVPKEELPAEAARRDNCYWGKNCRTQRKLHHAMRFNHICEQTKF